MTVALKQLLLLHILVTLCLTVSATSVLYFPFLPALSKMTYFYLIISAILLVMPLSFMISVLRLGSK